MKRPKVAHLSSVHYPDDPRIAIKECGALQDAGYDVVYVCPRRGAPHSPVPDLPTRFVPLASRRAARMTRTVWDVLRAALRERADAYHLHDAELLLIAPALRLTGAAVIYDAHEDLHDSIEARYWIPGAIRRLVAGGAGIFQWIASRVVTGIVAATPRIAERFPASKTVVVQNYSSIGELSTSTPTPYQRRQPTFLYIGAIADVRGAREMVHAMEQGPAEARLVMGGPYSEPELIAELKTYDGWRSVEHHPWQSRKQIAAHLDRARAGLVTLYPTRSYVESYPVKMFEYLAAGIPVIVSDFPLWRRLLDEDRCAIFVDPLDAGAIAAAMRWVLDHPEESERMGARGRLAVQQRFNWQIEAAKLVKLYDTLLSRSTFEIDARLRNA